MLELLQNWLIERGVAEAMSFYLARGLAFAAVLALSVVVHLFTRHMLLSALRFVITRTKTDWDDTILRHRVLNRLVHIAPAIVIYIFSPLALDGLTTLLAFVQGAAMIYMIVMLMLVLDGLINAAADVYRRFEVSQEIPVGGFVQVLKLALYFVTAIFVFSVILNKTPVYLLSGLGALTAVLMLIFRDAILGFVAGIQLSANRMVANGDWIEMPKYGADGDVLEVTLTTVKVQNWDKTITTIPTYALISESFKNWRGMQDSGGRRIKRAVNIDMGTIKFCDADMLERFSKIQYIAKYIETRQAELETYNRSIDADQTSLVNGRRMTNIGTFRAYVEAYLKNHPMINRDMTFLVRQLKPSENGLPIEIYVFCKDKVWANYEAIQSDIFDHILAVVPEFELRVFQNPTGDDFRSFAAPAT